MIQREEEDDEEEKAGRLVGRHGGRKEGYEGKGVFIRKRGKLVKGTTKKRTTQLPFPLKV